MSYIQYVLCSSVCLSFFYAAYLLIYRNEANLRQLRVYLLASIILSVSMPLSNYRISIDCFNKHSSVEKTISADSLEGKIYIIDSKEPVHDKQPMDWTALLKGLYFIISIGLLMRVVAQIIMLTIHYLKSNRKRLDGYMIVYNHRFKNTFSFFNWIFVNKDFSSGEDNDQVILHEKIHASQYHSVDLIMIELLVAIMWFNPLVWMMKNSIQLVHEYLADEGVLSTGIDRLRYQALLINQATEERLICLSSSFNHSLIKKRMIMMTKQKFNQRTKVKILALLPVSVVLFILIAGINGVFPSAVHASTNSYNKGILPASLNNPLNNVKQVADTSKEAKDISAGLEKSERDKTKEVAVVSYGPSKGKTDSLKVNYTLEGVKADNIAHVNPDSIKSVTVSKTDNEVVVITKKGNPNNGTIMLRNKKGNDMSNVIIIVDGVEQPKGMTLNNIDPDKIEKIEVVKNKDAAILVAKKDCEGVIKITTKLKDGVVKKQ